jgi:hypothetical protein
MRKFVGNVFTLSESMAAGLSHTLAARHLQLFPKLLGTDAKQQALSKIS